MLGPLFPSQAGGRSRFLADQIPSQVIGGTTSELIAALIAEMPWDKTMAWDKILGPGLTTSTRPVLSHERSVSIFAGMCQRRPSNNHYYYCSLEEMTHIVMSINQGTGNVSGLRTD